jgi:hypothetical protein
MLSAISGREDLPQSRISKKSKEKMKNFFDLFDFAVKLNSCE